ncbi:MAG: phosphatase PAP2 family protein [Paludibacteraceae bacterium]|nr:phosphatase PAP2 family protein [Paludibacteraceae bacterium]
MAFLYAQEPKAPCKQEVGLICLILAALEGYSRIYLSQHFLLDVTVGMTIGVLTSVGIFYIFLKKNVNFLAQFRKK